MHFAIIQMFRTFTFMHLLTDLILQCCLVYKSALIHLSSLTQSETGDLPFS